MGRVAVLISDVRARKVQLQVRGEFSTELKADLAGGAGIVFPTLTYREEILFNNFLFKIHSGE